MYVVWAKFIAGHNCLRSQLYYMLVESEVDHENEAEEFSDCMDFLDDPTGGQQVDTDRPIISLHALSGTDGYQTMRIQGKVKNHTMIILVDSGSTHNFVDQAMIRKLGTKLQPISNLTVTVANGERLQVEEICTDLPFEVQREQVVTNFFVLPLKGCDMVLGVQWLVTVGPILWDFQRLIMQFQLGDRTVQWFGLMAGALSFMNRKQAS